MPGPAGRLSSMSYTLIPIMTSSDGLSKKAHRLIGDITQLDSPFILQFISTPASEVSGQTCFLAAAVSCPLKATSSSRKIAALFKIPDICIEIRLLGEKNKGDKQ